MTDLRWVGQRGRPRAGTPRVNSKDPPRLSPADVARVAEGLEERWYQGQVVRDQAQPAGEQMGSPNPLPIPGADLPVAAPQQMEERALPLGFDDAQSFGEQMGLWSPLPISDEDPFVEAPQQMEEKALPLGFNQQPSPAAPPAPFDMDWGDLGLEAPESQPEPQAVYPTPPAEQAPLQDRPQQVVQPVAKVELGGMMFDQIPGVNMYQLWLDTFFPLPAFLDTMPAYQQMWYAEWNRACGENDEQSQCQLLEIRSNLYF
ncbi:hypothetical protein ACHAPU_003209 [Fusarium lateritium]